MNRNPTVEAMGCEHCAEGHLGVTNIRAIVFDKDEHMAAAYGWQDSLPVEDYSSAIAKALEWLGDSYVIAKPVTAVRTGRARDDSRPFSGCLWQERTARQETYRRRLTQCAQ